MLPVEMCSVSTIQHSLLRCYLKPFRRQTQVERLKRGVKDERNRLCSGYHSLLYVLNLPVMCAPSFLARWYVAYALLNTCTSLHRMFDRQIILIMSFLALFLSLLCVSVFAVLLCLSRSPSRVHDHKVNPFCSEYEI